MGQLRVNLQVQRHEAIWIIFAKYHHLNPEERAVIMLERVDRALVDEAVRHEYVCG